MWRPCLAALLLLTAGGGRARADEDAVYGIPTRVARIGRIILPVDVTCRGPFRFVLDTGASASVLSPHLAESLGLEVDPARPVTIRGVTGWSFASTAAVEELAAGATLLEKQ